MHRINQRHKRLVHFKRSIPHKSSLLRDIQKVTETVSIPIILQVLTKINRKMISKTVSHSQFQLSKLTDNFNEKKF